jgi:Flp pilus assembly protein TadD
LEPLLVQQPDYLRGHFLLGMCAAASERREQAERAFRKVIELDANQPAGYLALLQVLDLQGKTAELEKLRQEFELRFGEQPQAAAPAPSSPDPPGP